MTRPWRTEWTRHSGMVETYRAGEDDVAYALTAQVMFHSLRWLLRRIR